MCRLTEGTGALGITGLAWVGNKQVAYTVESERGKDISIMDDDGRNVEQIGYLNINSALHPTILKDGRVMFTSYESQGLRDLRLLAIWTIHPDGTNWAPLISDLINGATAFHFMTQLSDGQVVAEEYYNLNNEGFGTFYKLPTQPNESKPPFGLALLATLGICPTTAPVPTALPSLPRA